MLIDDLKVTDIKVPGQGNPDAGAGGDNPGAQGGENGSSGGSGEAAGADDPKNKGAAGGDAAGGKEAGSDAQGAAAAAAGDGSSASEDGEEYDEQAAFQSLSEETGVEIRSNEDIVQSLRALAGYKSGKIPGISPALQKAIEIERQGGDLTGFFRALSIDEASLADEEVLRNEYLGKAENQKVVKGNPKLATMNWKREFGSRYADYFKYQSLTDAAEKEQFYKENSEQIEYQKERYTFDVAEARKALKDQRDNFPVKVEGGMTQQEMDQLLEAHRQSAEQQLKAFKSVDLPIEGEEVYSVGLNATTKPIVEGWMNNPDSFLKAIGIYPDKFDYKQLMNVMTLVAAVSEPGFGSRLKKQILDNKDAQTLENDLNGTRKIDDTTRTGAGAQGDEFDQIGKAARERSQQRA